LSIEFSPAGRRLHELAADEAKAVLRKFLDLEKEAIDELRAKRFEVQLDYSQKSVSDFYRFVVTRTAEQFDEANPFKAPDAVLKVWFSRLAFYFGQALIELHPDLRWDIGRSETVFHNHPVVTGFAGNLEAPLITISRNVVTGILEGRNPISRIESTVEYWFGLACASSNPVIPPTFI
jgi:hypothetical protein